MFSNLVSVYLGCLDWIAAAIATELKLHVISPRRHEVRSISFPPYISSLPVRRSVQVLLFSVTLSLYTVRTFSNFVFNSFGILQQIIRNFNLPPHLFFESKPIVTIGFDSKNPVLFSELNRIVLYAYTGPNFTLCIGTNVFQLSHVWNASKVRLAEHFFDAYFEARLPLFDLGKNAQAHNGLSMEGIKCVSQSKMLCQLILFHSLITKTYYTGITIVPISGCMIRYIATCTRGCRVLIFMIRQRWYFPFRPLVRIWSCR